MDNSIELRHKRWDFITTDVIMKKQHIFVGPRFLKLVNKLLIFIVSFLKTENLNSPQQPSDRPPMGVGVMGDWELGIGNWDWALGRTYQF
jgi:hypothetical protein